MKLYRWQEECLDAWKSNGMRGIVHVVTGAGKTVFALAAIRKAREVFPDLSVRIVVPTIPLARQWEQALSHDSNEDKWRPDFFNENPGLFFGEQQDDPTGRLMIYVINSARKTLSIHIRRDLALKRHVLLICDECHHCQSKENRKIFQFLTREIADSGLYLSLGLSATPFGTENDHVLIRALGREVYRYDFDTAVKDGVISSFAVCEIAASFYGAELEKYAELSDQIAVLLRKLLALYPHLNGADEKVFMKSVSAIAKEADMDPQEPAAAFLLMTYERKRLTNLAAARTACCLGILKRLTDKDRVIIFCERISQACGIARIIRRMFGNICGIYHSEMVKDARARVLKEFRENETRILVSCRCLDEGIDVPDANIGIVMSSSAVERQRIQRLGRVIRRSDGKAAACLYYIYIKESTDNASYLPGLEHCETFFLRYHTAENEFSNSLYEYVGSSLLRRARERGMTPEEERELRLCLTEGLVRADYLLAETEKIQHILLAETVHERNYWKVMKRVGAEF